MNAIPQTSLKTLLREKLQGVAAVTNPLSFMVEIPAHTQMNIVDDLLDYDLTHTKLHFILHEQSQLTYSLKIVDVAASDIIAAEDVVVISSPDRVIDKAIHITLAGAGANATVKAVCMGTEQRSFKFKTIQEHTVGNTTSLLEVKGVFDDQSTMRCDSLIKVPESAQKVDAKQLNKNLLLSSQARAVSIPKLEVEANDVKCSHGAAVSNLDADSMFYLQSRGMNFIESKALLIEAFLS